MSRFFSIIILLYLSVALAKAEGYRYRQPFVRELDSIDATRGLSGANIAMWQSHGWYFEPKLDRWEWQRARIFQTVEDIYTQSYVIPFLMPMLTNAGAYVMSPRERDVRTEEIIIDGDGGFAQGNYIEKNGSFRWEDADSGFAYLKATLRGIENPFRAGKSRRVKTGGKRPASASWSADIPQEGDYAVYVSYTSSPENATKALYRINTSTGTRYFQVDQRRGGSTWIYLGHFHFNAGKSGTPLVELLAGQSEGGRFVSADAVKIGGGMGNVERIVSQPADSVAYECQKSGYPRFTEGARYWLQWAGAPDSVFTESGNVNDYTDDYKSRALWVNWVTGGSESLPGRNGLGIPIDLSFAFHSDAGTTLTDSVIGTLGIYCTIGDTLGDGTSRDISGTLTDMVMTSVVNDIRATFEPAWIRRDMWNKSYYEARVPMVPAMLLELLSHQNFADMKYGLDPAFRFTVSRAIYKGMLRFLSARYGVDYVVQPLPVRDFAITRETQGCYMLSWDATTDSLESTATPSRYIIEERQGISGGFRRVGVVDSTRWRVKVDDHIIHSFRIIAVNDGGRSFPSEVLAFAEGEGVPVTVINGFTRISAPDTFDSGEIAGFYSERDGGVPYVADISFIGNQFEFRREIPWMDDDAAGFGASRANYEDKVIAGNTFDYVALHGEAILAAGYGFVSSSLTAFEKNPSVPAGGCIDLILGKQKECQSGRGAYGTRYKAFTPALQKALTKVANAGSSVFVSGSYVASDLWDNPYTPDSLRESDKIFASEVLGYKWRVGQATVGGAAFMVPSRFRMFGKGEFHFSQLPGPMTYAVESPDSFYPADAARGATIMRYSENNLVAGVASDMGAYRTVVIGFPFETIESRDARHSLMCDILNFFNEKEH